MTLKTVVFLVIGLAIVYKFIISPLIQVIVSINEIKNIKKNIKKLGLIIQKNNSDKKNKVKTICLVCFLIITPLSVTFKAYELLIGSIYLLYLFLVFLKIENYSKYNGIYENGIINKSIIYWEDVFSFKVNNEDSISFLLNTGLRFDLKQKNISQVIDVLKHKEIKQEN